MIECALRLSNWPDERSKRWKRWKRPERRQRYERIRGETRTGFEAEVIYPGITQLQGNVRNANRDADRSRNRGRSKPTKVSEENSSHALGGIQ